MAIGALRVIDHPRRIEEAGAVYPAFAEVVAFPVIKATRYP